MKKITHKDYKQCFFNIFAYLKQEVWSRNGCRTNEN